MTSPDSNTPISNEEHPSSWIKARILSEYRKHIKIDWPEIAARKIYSTIEDNIISGYESELTRLNQTIADIEKDACEFAEFTHMNGWKPSTVDGRMWINPKQNLASTTAHLYQQFKLQMKGKDK